MSNEFRDILKHCRFCVIRSNVLNFEFYWSISIVNYRIILVYNDYIEQWQCVVQ